MVARRPLSRPFHPPPRRTPIVNPKTYSAAAHPASANHHRAIAWFRLGFLCSNLQNIIMMVVFKGPGRRKHSRFGFFYGGINHLATNEQTSVDHLSPSLFERNNHRKPEIGVSSPTFPCYRSKSKLKKWVFLNF